MTPADRKHFEVMIDNLRTCLIPGVDNVGELYKEWNLLYSYALSRAEQGDTLARQVIEAVSKPLPNKF